MQKIDQINNMPHSEIPDAARDKFIEIYNSKFKEGGEVFFEEQKALFVRELESGSYANMLKNASPTSIYFAFLFLAINGISLERGLTTTCYLECKRKCIGKNAEGNKIYESTAEISVTGYGEILLRQRAGQIRSVDSPKLVYDCDTFRVGEDRNGSYVICERCIPRPQGSRIIACYVRIVKSNGDTDYFVLDTDEIKRLKSYSAQSNFGKVNELYGHNEDCSDIDTGFLKSKTVKHAFKGYPKLPIGVGGVMEADKDEESVEQENGTMAPVISGGVQFDAPEEGPF